MKLSEKELDIISDALYHYEAALEGENNQAADEAAILNARVVTELGQSDERLFAIMDRGVR